MDEFSCDALESCPNFLQANRQDDSDHADDATWILTSSFVILTMQSGFALLEMGSSSPGSSVNIMLKNVYDVIFGGLAYYMIGYGISYGHPSNRFMGLGDFFPDSSNPATDDSSVKGLLFSTYIFQFSFAATSTTIVSGAIAMRMRFFVYCAFSFYAVMAYAFVAHWIWAPTGWLHQMGVHDFAGSGVVHLFGATNGLVAILMVGPRTGRFDGQRPAADFAPGSPTSQLFGLFVLWWGWIGFNCGSSFGITNSKWLLATRAAVTTMNGTTGGGVAALIYTQIKTKRKLVLPTDIVNGILASLVSVTACCASIHTFEAIIIGAVGSVLALATNDWVEHKLQLDDPVGVIGVHGAAALWSLLSVGLFADGDLPAVNVDDGLFRGGGLHLLGVQMLEMVSVMGWSICCATPFFYLMGIMLSGNWRDPRSGLRIGDEEEAMGADRSLHGCCDESARTLETLLERSGYYNRGSRQLLQQSSGNLFLSSMTHTIAESLKESSDDEKDIKETCDVEEQGVSTEECIQPAPPPSTLQQEEQPASSPSQSLLQLELTPSITQFHQAAMETQPRKVNELPLVEKQEQLHASTSPPPQRLSQLKQTLEQPSRRRIFQEAAMKAKTGRKTDHIEAGPLHRTQVHNPDLFHF